MLLIAGSNLSPSATLSYKIADQEDLSATIKDRTQQTFAPLQPHGLYLQEEAICLV